MFRPMTARNLNRQFRRADIVPLPSELIAYADEAIRGLHAALKVQTDPVYHRPEHPVDGWGLTSTPLRHEALFMGVPVVTLLGSRAVYLSAKREVIHRVLTVPHPRNLFVNRVVQVKNTTVPDLLFEDPTLYQGLLDSAEESIQEFRLDYQLPDAPISNEL